MHDTGCLGLVHWDDSEGLYGEGCGRGIQEARVQPWWIHVDIWQNQYNIVKFKNKKKIKKKTFQPQKQKKTTNIHSQ